MKHLVLLPSGASASSLQLRSSRSAAAAAPARPRRQRGAARHRHLAVAAAPADGARSDAAGQNVQQNAAVAGDATADAGSQPGSQGSTAAAGEQPAVQQAAPARSQRWRAMLLSCWRLLQRSLWPLVVAHGVTDALVFLLHRLSHRATNEVAVRLLGGGLLTPAAIGNMWWLNTDPAIANFKTGYQLLTFAFFLLAFPLNVAIKTWASCATILLCRRAQQQPEEEEQAQAQQQQTAAAAQGEGPATEAGQAAAPAEGNGAVPQAGAAPWWNVRRGLRQAFGTLRSINGEVAALWRPVFIVELLVAAVVVPAQFASLAVITLPFTLPLIVELQAAGPAAALEGVRGTAAMARSRALLRGLRWQLAVPFVGLVVAGRLLEGAKAALLSNLPPRFYQELVELPLLVLVGGTLLSILLARMQDVLPMVAYAEGKQAEAVAAAQAGASQGASNGASGKGSQGASNGASGGDGGSK